MKKIRRKEEGMGVGVRGRGEVRGWIAVWYK